MSIYKKMHNVMKSCSSIEQNGWNKHGNYKYVKAVDVVGMIRKFMIENGILLTINEDEYKREKIEKKMPGNNFSISMHSSIKRRARFVDIDNEKDFIEIEFFGVAQDQTDKDIYKSKTGALKYLLIETFLLPSDDFKDPEKDEEAKQIKKNIKDGDNEERIELIKSIISLSKKMDKEKVRSSMIMRFNINSFNQIRGLDIKQLYEIEKHLKNLNMSDINE